MSENLPFSLAYLDWCRDTKGIKNIKETENSYLVKQFYLEVWEKTGKPVNGIEYGIATGRIFNS